MKKIINKVENILHEMLEGISKAHPDILEKVENYNIIKRKDIKNKVNLISGGGSGHEPAHAGFRPFAVAHCSVAV